MYLKIQHYKKMLTLRTIHLRRRKLSIHVLKRKVCNNLLAHFKPSWGLLHDFVYGADRAAFKAELFCKLMNTSCYAYHYN